MKVIKPKIIVLGPGKVIKLNFENFEVEYRGTSDCDTCKPCEFDYVAIYDGPSTTDPTLR